MINTCCFYCGFWDETEQDNLQEGLVDLGTCRKNPPLIVLGQVPVRLQAEEFPEEAEENAFDGVWPVTKDCDWCGAFEKITNAKVLRDLNARQAVKNRREAELILSIFKTTNKDLVEDHPQTD